MATIRYRHMNENDRYVGESHPKAKLSDDDVRRMRIMHETFGLSDRWLSKIWNTPRRTVRDILSYKVRSEIATKSVKQNDET